MDVGFKVDVTELENEGVQMVLRLESPNGATILKLHFETYDELAAGVKKVKERLDGAMEKARELFEAPAGKKPTTSSEFSPSDDPEKNWLGLESIGSDEEFFRAFNKMSEERRRAVADLVLTKMNIFKGRASVFSIHFSEDDAVLER